MPVFINEVVIRASVERPPAGSRSPMPTAEPVNRDVLVAEVKQAVMDYLERELDRSGER
jgi:hypothetical protein